MLNPELIQEKCPLTQEPGQEKRPLTHYVRKGSAFYEGMRYITAGIEPAVPLWDRVFLQGSL